jgi:hypothetical protein
MPIGEAVGHREPRLAMLHRALWGCLAHACVDHGPRLRVEGNDRRALAVFLAADTAMPRFR